MGTSNASPFTTRCFVPLPEPKVALTVFPVFFSNAGIICSTAARIPPGAISVISAAERFDEIEIANTATAAEMTRMRFLLDQWTGLVAVAVYDRIRRQIGERLNGQRWIEAAAHR